MLLLSSCGIFRQPTVSVSSTLDYSKYLKDGFYLTESNSVSFTHEPLASVSALQLSGYKIKSSGQKQFRDDAYQTGHSETYTTTTNEYVNATRSEVLEQLVKEAKSKGANGIINLDIDPIVTTTKEGLVSISGYSATGMAIKR